MLPLLIILGGAAYSSVRALQQHRQEQAAQAAVVEPSPAASPTAPPNIEPVRPVDEDRDRSAEMQMIEEPEIDHYLKVTAVAVGTSVAAMFYPPAGLAAVSLLTYLAVPLFKSAAIATFVEVKPRSCHVEAIVYAASMASGYYVLTSLCSGVYFFGSKLRVKTQMRSTHRLQNLFGENPRQVWLNYDDVEVEVPFSSLQVGDTIVLQAGEFVPIDGTVVRGIGTVDQRTLTGESMPVEKGSGDTVFASTSLLSGKLYVRVEKTGAATTAASIQRILNGTANYTDDVEQEASRFANRMAGPTLLAGGATMLFMGPMSGIAVIGSDQSELNRISGPLGMLNYLELSSQRGILIKDGRCLEILKTVDTVVFDKTGTLTQDQPQIGYIHCFGDISENEVLRLAAAAEAKQSHPIAAAILAEAQQRGINIPPLDEALYEIGYGLKVEIDHHQVHVGSARYMYNEHIQIADRPHLDAVRAHCDQHGFSLVYIARDGALVGVLELHATLRPEARAVVEQLQERGLELIIVSGDNEQPTRLLAAQVGIQRYHANVLPDEKAKVIQQLRAEGKSICFVGDGINDAVALKTANVGVSIHGASDAALDTAGVILMDRTLNELGTLFQFADDIARTRRHGYYATMIPTGIGVVGVLGFGFGLPAALMLYSVGGLAAVGTAMWPKVAYRKAPRLPPPVDVID